MKFEKVFHTQEHLFPILKMPIKGTGNDMWLGDGFYFWQDLEFAHIWGIDKKSSGANKMYQIFVATLEFEEEDYIDTVFNEHDYYNFVSTVERFADEYYSTYKEKPTLEDFNDFIMDNNLWNNIKVIRFQDLPDNNRHLKVLNYYYKKRIQIRVNRPEIITNFAPLKK